MVYEVPALPYPYDALEPHIDAETMEIHHARHHGGYVNNLNKILDGHRELQSLPLEEILYDIARVPEAIRQDVRNYAGGHLNHSFFWRIMTPGGSEPPQGTLGQTLIEQFGSFRRMSDKFTQAALARFGSGWAWLAVEGNGQLTIFSTPNQDSPLMYGCQPILGLDVWEHAYYLKYQSRRSDYITAWWSVVNWNRVAELYARCASRIERKSK
ncbi:MAG: superoxide dismutase [Planctomycetaceae bacterium]|nr:superoxide dismutase [Planctomycetaceae bacterium]